MAARPVGSTIAANRIYSVWLLHSGCALQAVKLVVKRVVLPSVMKLRFGIDIFWSFHEQLIVFIGCG